MTNASRRGTRANADRADLVLCARGLAETRTKAQALIRGRRVRVDGRLVNKSSTPIRSDAHIEVSAGRDFVSRGGGKLDGALADLGVALDGVIVVDVGASTGGFTDAALTHGARRVYAVDVGEGLLDERLVRDPRVVVHERVNARTLERTDFPEPVDVVLVDASFISLDKLAPALFRVLRRGGVLIALIKPEFEIGRAAARSTRGVVRDPNLREQAIENARRALVAVGFEIKGEVDSRVAGKKGNIERFVWAKRR